MTTVLFYKDCVYADSTVIKGSERLDCLTKIRALDVPMKIVSTKENFEVDDTLYGYSGTGSIPAMEGLIQCLSTSMETGEDINGAIAHYKMAYAGGLMTPDTIFDCILVGEKGNHSFCFDRNGFVYKFFDRDKIVGLGSGGSEAMTHVKHHGDPVRAMLQAFATDYLSGGWVDCWQFKQVTETIGDETMTRYVFRRRGMREPIPKDLIFQVLDMHWPTPGKDKVPLQFGREVKFRNELTKVYLENKSMATELDEKDAQIVKLEEDAVATAIIHQNEIAKLKKKIAQMKKEAKPITVKDLRMPPKIEVPEAAAAQLPPRRRAIKSAVGDAVNYR